MATAIDASPAYVGEDELVHGQAAKNLAERGQVEQPVKTSAEKIKAGGAPKEKADGIKKARETPAPEGKHKESTPIDSGPLMGVAGAGEENYQPMTGPNVPAAGATPPTAVSSEGADAAGAESGAAGGAESDAEASGTQGNEAAIVQQLRSGKVGQQKNNQQQSKKNMAGAGAIRDLTSQAAVEAQMMADRAYKQAWQYAQEVSEDGALSIAGFLIFAPISIGLYILRWMFGNMMGDLFKKEVTIPFSSAITGGETSKISLKIFPPYALADLQDYERHFKFILIGGLTIIIVGFITMLLYYYTHPVKALIDAFKLGWQAIINSIPAYNP